MVERVDKTELAANFKGNSLLAEVAKLHQPGTTEYYRVNKYLTDK